MYITDMCEAYCTYADDKYFDNHDYDDDTGDDTDHKNDSYTASGVAPGAGAAPGPYGSHGEDTEETWRKRDLLPRRRSWGSFPGSSSWK